MPSDLPAELDFDLPLRGVFRGAARHRTPPGFTPDAQNVIAYDSGGRARVGTRPGTSKYWTLQFGGGAVAIQHMHQCTVQDTTGGTTSSYVIVVAGGRAYRMAPSDTTLQPIDGGSAVFSASRFVDAVTLFNKTWFTDGLVVKVYDHAAGSMGNWTATAGTFPVAGSQYPRFLCAWRGRIVVAHLDKEAPGAVYLSAMGDPTNWDYAPASGTTPTQAVALNSEFRAGQLGEPVTALIPTTEDELIIGQDHSIHRLVGDPMAGGSLMPISETIGIVGPRAWCQVGRTLYFCGSGGFYKLEMGGQPQNLSRYAVNDVFKSLPQKGYYVSCQFDAKRHGIWIFIQLALDPFTSTHLFYDLRAEDADGVGGFWPVAFPDDTGGDDLDGGTTAPKHGPAATCVFDGYDATVSDRVVLLGGRDGYVRAVDDAEKNDDGTAIASYVNSAPLQPFGPAREAMVNGWIPVLGEDGNTNCVWTIYAARDPYTVVDTPAQNRTGTFTIGTGWQGVLGHRIAGNTLMLALSNSALGKGFSWERMTLLVEPGGPNRG